MTDLRWRIFAVGIGIFLVLTAAVMEQTSAEEIAAHSQNHHEAVEQRADSVNPGQTAAGMISADWVCAVILGEAAVVASGAWIVTHAPGNGR